MKFNKEILELVSEIEYAIGRNCYNPKSTNGYTGEVGKQFRYPVNVRHAGIWAERKNYGRVELSSNAELQTMKYKFGANHLMIGNAIVDLLEFLEKRYDIDFNKLEECRK